MSRTALALCGMLATAPALAQAPQRSPVPPAPAVAEVERGVREAASPLNNPVTGADTVPRISGVTPPPSLEALQALRPLVLADKGADGLRSKALCEQAESYGAQGGLAAKSFALTEMLRRYEAQLDQAFDFAPLVREVGPRTLFVPPVITEAQMAFALAEGGQQARTTGRVYEIRQQGELAAVKPNWRSYLVPVVSPPAAPPDQMRPRTDKEAKLWQDCVTKGWAEGEGLAVTNFLSGLGELATAWHGMARYLVLEKHGLVDRLDVAVKRLKTTGGGNRMGIDDATTTIRKQPGLNSNPQRWRPMPQIDAGRPIGTIGGP